MTAAHQHDWVANDSWDGSFGKAPYPVHQCALCNVVDDRPARRFDEAELLNPSFMFEAEREALDRETREEFRSGGVILYLAVILAIVAGAAIAWLWWTFR